MTFLVERTGFRARLQEMWRRDIARSVAAADRHTGKAIGKLGRLLDESRQFQHASAVAVRDVEKRLAASDAAVRNLEQRLTELERTALVDSRQARQVADWQLRFSPAGICAHVTRVVSEAPLREDPAAHLLVERLFPPDFYELLLASLPEMDLFQSSDSNEMYLRPAEFGVVPRLTGLVWEFIDTHVARAVAGAALQRLRPVIEARYEALFGREWAEAVLGLSHESSGGRMMLWRRGYCEKPHLDPKRTSVTALVYLARPGDPETGGTMLYSIDGDFAPVHTKTSYPDVHGLSCTLVSRVPFRPNSALILVNAGGAHGTEVPDDMPSDLVRYAFELQIGPSAQQLLDFVSTLPPSDQQQWLDLAALRAT
ncbi:MAG: hypothetical protein ACRD8O_15845 [Bryobacteraceae bacterium]